MTGSPLHRRPAFSFVDFCKLTSAFMAAMAMFVALIYAALVAL